MKSTSNPNQAVRTARTLPCRRLLGACAAVAVLVLASVDARAAAPLAGSTIGNQASATYTDASNTVHTTTSNVTLTVIQQVASLSLSSDQAKSVSPGGQAVFPHTLNNTGNGADTFTLSVAQLSGDNFDLTNAAIYADANGDGLPDNSIPITTTGLIAAGGKFQFVVVGTVPSSQTSGQTAQVRVTATSTFDPTKTANNTDTTTAGANAVVQVTQSVNPTIGASPSGPYTFTITFTNTGNTAATGVTLTDTLSSSLTYAAGTAHWSASGSTALTDAAGGDPTGISYDYGITVAGRMTAVIATLAPGQSGTLTFQANVPAGTPSGLIPNTVGYSYNDGAAAAGPFTSNTVQITITQPPSVQLTGDTVASATQGSTVSFTNVVKNTGTGTETFNVTTTGSTFPAGTTFRLVRSDGVTAMLDSNGDGIPDTGPLAAGASFTVVLRATLPPGSTGGPYTVNKVATAISDPTVSATCTDTLTAIVTSAVDLMADAAGTLGIGAGPETNPVVTLPGNPGATVRFTLDVKNGSGVADTYNFDVSTVSDFSTTGLPAGWTVVYRDASNNVLTKTGLLNSLASQVVYADVTIPAGQAPGTQQVYFRAQSAVTNSSDRLHDAIAINTVRGLTLVASNTGQVYPGGAQVFSHTLTNTGNVLEGDNLASTIALGLNNTIAGWNCAVYFDANGNGIIDAGEAVVTDLSFLSNGAAGLAPGESVKLLVKVFAPASATIGAVNTTVLTATVSNGTLLTSVPTVVTVNDTLNVILSDLKIVKEQALDANGDGVADTAFGTGSITSGAVPGACVRYRITVTNTGSVDALSVVVNDITPTFTTYHAVVPAATTVGTVQSVPGAGSAGAVTVNVGTLAPGASAVVTFGVKIDQ